eukprot:scaffold18599_cov58-Phaeocystis_antarctica.AAC.1
MGVGRGSRVAVDVELVSLGERQRRQLRLALADVSQFVGRPDIRARVTHRLADEVVDGGRRQRREEVANETQVVCAPWSSVGGPGPRERRTEDVNVPDLLVVEAPLQRGHVNIFKQLVARHLGHLEPAVDLVHHHAASFLCIKAHEAEVRAKPTNGGDVRRGGECELNVLLDAVYAFVGAHLKYCRAAVVVEPGLVEVEAPLVERRVEREIRPHALVSGEGRDCRDHERKHDCDHGGHGGCALSSQCITEAQQLVVRVTLAVHPNTNSAPGARWAGSGLPLPFGAETPLPLPLAQQSALGWMVWPRRAVGLVGRVRAREGLASKAWAWFSGSPLC